MAGALLTLALATAALTAPPVPDTELAVMRGGFRLPGGIDVALTVRSDTSVNGALLLRSVFSVVGNTPVLQVLAPAKGAEASTIVQGNASSVAAVGDTVAAGSATGAAAGAAGGNGVSVQFDRQNGVVFVPGGSSVAPAIAVTTGAAAAASDAAAEGLSVIPVAIGTAPIATAGGQVSVSALRDGARIRLEGAGIDVSHVVGAAFGSVIANIANDRTIDTTTTIGLDLANAGPDVIGSAMFQVENVAVESARLGIR